jgi:hypothetical protein
MKIKMQTLVGSYDYGKHWIVCKTPELADTVKRYGLDSLEVKLTSSYHVGKSWIVCETRGLSDTGYTFISLEVELTYQYYHMLKSGIIKRKAKMVIVGRSDMMLPETMTLLGKNIPVIQDDRIKMTEMDGLKHSTVYLMRRKDYKRMIKNAD